MNDFGDLSNETDEEVDNHFFQHGRFFGVSVGLGLETVDGNRGVLWKGGFPVFDLKVHYWFDFNFALDLGVRTSSHNYFTTVGGRDQVDVNLFATYIDLKYYFDTKNLSAPISFSNPYLLLGGGYFNKTESSFRQAGNDIDGSMGLSVGGGLEFVVKPRKMYLELEGKAHFVNFKDTYTPEYKAQSGVSKTPVLDDLTGRFYTFTANFLFTW